MSAEVVLHVGMPHAGEVIERALGRLRPQLRANGVAYVSAAQLDGLKHSAGWGIGPQSVRSAADDFAAELRTLVEVERRRASGLRGQRPTRVVIAAQNLLGSGMLGRRDTPVFRPFAARAVQQVARAIGGNGVTVVLHTHRQDRLMELQQLRLLRTGNLTPLTEWFPYWQQPQLDYRDLVARLRTVTQVSRVVVRPTELLAAGTHAFVNDFLASLELRDRLDLYRIGADIAPFPAVLSKQGVALARAVGPLMTGVQEVQRWNKFLGVHHIENSPLPTDLFSGAARAEILTAYSDANRALFDEHMPDLDPGSYSDDVATYALGNVLTQPRTAKLTALEKVRGEYEPVATSLVGAVRRRAARLTARAR